MCNLSVNCLGDEMKIIIRPRRMGKTTELIKQSGKEWKYIVCHSHQEAIRIQEQARRINIKIPLPITYQEFLAKEYYGKRIKGFLIDNIDFLLQYISIVKIDTITLTKEDE